MKPIVKALQNGVYEYVTVKDVGDLDQLKTNIKTDLVAAINGLIDGGITGLGGMTSDEVNSIIDAAVSQSKSDLQGVIGNQSASDLEAARKAAEALANKMLQDALDKVAELNTQMTTDIKAAKDELSANLKAAQDEAAENLRTVTAQADATDQSLKDTKDDLEDTKAELQKVTEASTKVYQDIDKINGVIDQKVDSTDFDLLNNAVEKNSTEIKQTKEKVELSATKEELDLLTEDVSKAKASIDLTNDKIAQTVSREDLAGELDAWDMQKANLLSDSRTWDSNTWKASNDAAVTITGDKYQSATILTFDNETGKVSASVSGLTVGKTYTLSVFARKQTTSGEIEIHSSLNKNAFKNSSNDTYIGNESMQRFFTTFVAEAETVMVDIYATGNTDSNIVYLAKAKLETGDKPTTWEPNSNDVFASVDILKAERIQTAGKIEDLVKRQKEIGEKQVTEEAFRTQTEEKLTSQAETIEKQGKDITATKSSIEQTSTEIKQTVSKETSDKLAALQAGSSNLINNSDFSQGKDVSWTGMSAQDTIYTDKNKTAWLKLAQTGTKAENILTAYSNYFPVQKSDSLAVTAQFMVKDFAELADKRVVKVEFYDKDNIRVDFTELSLTDLGVTDSIASMSAKNIAYKTTVTRDDIAKARVLPILHRDGEIYFTKFYARLTSFIDGSWQMSPDDLIKTQLALKTEIDQTNEKITLKADNTTLNGLEDKVDDNHSEFTLANDAIKGRVEKTEGSIDDLTGDIKSIKSDYSELTQGPDSITAKVTSLQGEMDKNTDELSSQKEKVSTLEQTAEGFKTTVSAVDNLQVGGRNFFPHADTFEGWSLSSFWTKDSSTFDGQSVLKGNQSVGDAGHGFQCNVSCVNSDVIVSFYARTDATGTVKIHSEPNGVSGGTGRTDFTLSTTWTRYSYKAHIGNSQTLYWWALTTGVNIYFSEPQVEIGTIPTAWKVSPEDVSDRFSKVEQTANSVSSTVADMNAKGAIQDRVANIEQTAEGFKTTVTAVENLQVGGTNLLRNSRGKFQPNKSTTDNYHIYTDSAVYMTQGQQYTVHADASSGLVWSGTHDPSVESNRVVLWLVTGTQNVNTIISDANTGTGTTFTWNYPSGTYYPRVNTYKSDNSGYAENVKLEKGTIATDWSPAPEDISTGIATAQDTANAAAKNLDDYKQVVTEHFSSIDQTSDKIKLSVSSVETTANSAKSSIDGLQVGGVNLLSLNNISMNSALTSQKFDYSDGSFQGTIPAGASTSIFGIGISLTGDGSSTGAILPYGKTATFAVDVMVSKDTTGVIDINNAPVYGTAWHGNDNDSVRLPAITPTFDLKANVWTTMWYTITNADSRNTSFVSLYDGSAIGVKNTTSGSITAIFRHPRWVLGNVIPEWTPCQDDVKVGGVNLLPNTDSFSDWALAYGATKDSSSPAVVHYPKKDSSGTPNDFLFYDQVASLKPDTDYVLSFTARGSGNLTTYVYPNVGTVDTDNNQTWTLTGADKRYVKKFHTLSNISDKKKLLFRNNGTTLEAWISQVKLEAGTVATEWSQAPEDTITRISLIEQNAEGIKTTVSAMNEKGPLQNRVSTVEQTADGLKTTVGNIRQAGKNLIYNGDAELGLDGWTSNSINNVYLSTHPYWYNGKKNFITLRPRGTGTNDETFLCSLKAIPVKQNTTYHLHFHWIAPVNFSSIDVLQGQTVADYLTQGWKPAGDNGVYDKDFNTGNRDSVVIRIDLNGANDGKSTWLGLSEICLTEGAGIVPYSPSAADSADSLKFSQLSQTVDGFKTTVSNLQTDVKPIQWQTISTASDFNTYKTTGKWFFATTSLTNAPSVGGYGYLIVEAAGDRLIQTYQKDNSNSGQFQRILIGGNNWSDWKRIANDGDVKSLKDADDKINGSVSEIKQAADSVTTTVKQMNANGKVQDRISTLEQTADGLKTYVGSNINPNLVTNSGYPTIMNGYGWTYINNVVIAKHYFYRNGKANLFQLNNTSTTAETYLGTNRFPVTPGNKYTVSFLGFASSNVKNMDVFFLSRPSGSGDDFTKVTQMIGSRVLSPERAEYVTVTFTVPDGVDEGFLRFDNNSSTDGKLAGLFLAEIKCEYGEIATPWSKDAADTLVTQTANNWSVFAQNNGLITGISVDANGVIDMSAKKVTIPGALIVGGSIPADALKNGSITNTQLADNSVGSSKIANGAITSGKIANGAIANINLADNSVSTAKIAGGAITASQIGKDAITSVQIKDGAVTAGAIAAGAVGASAIAANAVSANNIAAGAISADKIRADAIDGKTIKGSKFTSTFSNVQPTGFAQTVSGTSTLADGSLVTDVYQNGTSTKISHNELNQLGMVTQQYIGDKVGMQALLGQGQLDLGGYFSPLAGGNPVWNESTLSARTLYLLNNTGKAIWNGVSLMGSNQTINAKVLLENTLVGWVFQWSQYDTVANTFNNNNWTYCLVPKAHNIGHDPNKGWSVEMPIVIPNKGNFTKVVWIANSQIGGDRSGTIGLQVNACLRAIYAV